MSDAKKSKEIDLAALGLNDPVPTSKSSTVQVSPTVVRETPKPSPPRLEPKDPPASKAVTMPQMPESVNPNTACSQVFISGIVLASFGLALMAYFGFFYETAVSNEVGVSHTIYDKQFEWTYNTGLQQNRIVGFLGGAVNWVVGLLAVAVSRIAMHVGKSTER